MTIKMIPSPNQSPMTGIGSPKLNITEELASSLVEKMGLCYNQDGNLVYQGVLCEVEGLPMTLVISSVKPLLSLMPGTPLQVRMMVTWFEKIMRDEGLVDGDMSKFIKEIKPVL